MIKKNISRLENDRKLLIDDNKNEVIAPKIIIKLSERNENNIYTLDKEVITKAVIPKIEEFYEEENRHKLIDEDFLLSDENDTVCTKIEEEDKTIVHEFIGADGKVWDEKISLKVCVKKEDEEEVSTDRGEIFEENECTLCASPTSCKSPSCSHCISNQTPEKSDFEKYVNNVHRVIKLYKCSNCDYQNALEYDLQEYINKQHLDIKSYKCSNCKFEESTNDDFTKNLNGIQFVRSHKCSQCDYQSTKKSNLKQHIIRVHLGLKQYKCDQCDYKSAQKSHVNHHLNSVHLGIKEYKCNQCDHQATTKSDLNRHVNSVHLSIRNHKCVYCDYKANENSSLKKHINSVHLDIREHECNHCDYRATRKRTLKNHINSVHLGLKNHKCDQCDYSSSTTSGLRKHIKGVHLGIKRSQTTRNSKHVNTV
ncbi:hypothetical protein HHI36_020791 [Cryptolaemus montrouzieri]|uniref:C2H2-type domain-containing protein n=1 Tax=Cryptolaemus montrouzieri TaxID=559131 RepID=A0ABD2NC61_9CUCU